MTFRTRGAILTTAALALTLAACGATTGTALKTQAAMSAASSVMNNGTAAESKPAALTATATTKPGDGSMSCEELTAEIGKLDKDIEQANVDYEAATGRNMGDSATNAAASYAVAKSGIANKVPFGGMLAKSALKSGQKKKEKKAKKAVAKAEAANLRRTSLMGIYTGKGCE